MNYVLDASALLVLLNQERGTKIVENYIDSSMISAVNISEVAGKMLDRGIDTKELDLIFKLLPIKIVNFDFEQSLIAAKIKNKTYKQGLSLGDRACLALAIKFNSTALTADKAWKNLALKVKIKFVR